jgi:hypothetical protein
LSALNPLQYLPVVGTIYRAVTGDTIPEALRLGGSMLVSGLIGGPIGLVTNIGATVAEKATGIDPEKIARRVAATLGLTISHPTSPQAPAPASAVAAASSPPRGWSKAELANEGVTFASDGTPSQHGLQGAEALNAIELSRIHNAVAAYSRAAALVS